MFFMESVVLGECNQCTYSTILIASASLSAIQHVPDFFEQKSNNLFKLMGKHPHFLLLKVLALMYTLQALGSNPVLG